MTTLSCGHPPDYIFGGCMICRGDDGAVLTYAAELCGLDRIIDRSIDHWPLPFARAIVADPDNPTPKLVLADFLEEAGDVRGELIRVECELRQVCIEMKHNESGTLLRWDYMADDQPQVDALIARRAALRLQLGYDPTQPDVDDMGYGDLNDLPF